MKKKKPSLYGFRKRKDYQLRMDFNIQIEVYDLILEEQEHRCGICRAHISNLDKSLAVDHCHETGMIRGLLCSKCNLGLGSFKDSIPILARAILYLEDFAKKQGAGEEPNL